MSSIFPMFPLKFQTFKVVSYPIPTSSQVNHPPYVHPIPTILKSGIVKPRLMPTVPPTHSEPITAKEALANPNWHASTKTEYDALMKNST
jgi:hypothetical protein